MPQDLKQQSRYLAAQRAQGLTRPQDLRPDLVLRLNEPGQPPRWLLLEAKTSTVGRPVQVLLRRALGDLLAYRSTYPEALRTQAHWGLGVVWGEELNAAEHPVGVCTPDRLQDALSRLLAPAVDG